MKWNNEWSLFFHFDHVQFDKKTNDSEQIDVVTKTYRRSLNQLCGAFWDAF